MDSVNTTILCVDSRQAHAPDRARGTAIDGPTRLAQIYVGRYRSKPNDLVFLKQIPGKFLSLLTPEDTRESVTSKPDAEWV
jgi:hypothetical protein